jgi:hypothetical protein
VRVSAAPCVTGSMGTPARAYSFDVQSDSAQKCGGVQRKMRPNRSQASVAHVPVAAAQPITGGNAPAAPPMTMFCGVERLSHIV